jgi:hypothetical protein
MKKLFWLSVFLMTGITGYGQGMIDHTEYRRGSKL